MMCQNGMGGGGNQTGGDIQRRQGRSFGCRLAKRKDIARLAQIEELCFAGERWNEEMLIEMLENPCAKMFLLLASSQTNANVAANTNTRPGQSLHIENTALPVTLLCAADAKQPKTAACIQTHVTETNNKEPIVIGWGGIWCMADEAEIASVCVIPAYRRLGGGTVLLQTLLEQSVKAGARNVYLEVRASNLAAQALYRQFGFVCIGERKRYYHDPVENAVLMRWTATESADVSEPSNVKEEPFPFSD